jgi:alanine-glyoxylate transaminase/(R)-3-amino-2-methylpropionate-pyruvate transaminase
MYCPSEQVVLFHRKVIEAAAQQLNTLWHTTNIYLNPKLHEYAIKLTSTLPGDLKVVE